MFFVERFQEKSSKLCIFGEFLILEKLKIVWKAFSIFSCQMEAIVYVWRLFFICFDLADDLLFSYQVLALAQSLRGKLKIRFLPYDY